jgi:hypothetical protein
MVRISFSPSILDQPSSEPWPFVSLSVEIWNCCLWVLCLTKKSREVAKSEVAAVRSGWCGGRWTRA